MKDKKTYYLTLMAGILLFTFLVPVLIRAGSRAFISRFAPGVNAGENETEAEGYRVMEGYTEAEENPLPGTAHIRFCPQDTALFSVYSLLGSVSYILPT